MQKRKKVQDTTNGKKKKTTKQKSWSSDYGSESRKGKTARRKEVADI